MASGAGFRFRSDPCLLTVRAARYAAGCLAAADWGRVPVGSWVLVRLSSELCPLLPALVTSNTLALGTPDCPGRLGLLLRPSLACQPVHHQFPAARIRSLFLTWYRFPPLP